MATIFLNPMKVGYDFSSATKLIAELSDICLGNRNGMLKISNDLYGLAYAILSDNDYL